MLRKKRLRSSDSWVKCVGLGTGIVFGIAAIGFYFYQTKCVGSEETEYTGRKNKTSRCIVMTESLCENKKTDWPDLLKHDVVLLVAPGATIPDECRTNVHDKYKIIDCETLVGVWACVRHLNKEQLILNSRELAGGIPEDIPRYTKELIDFQDAESSFLRSV